MNHHVSMISSDTITVEYTFTEAEKLFFVNGGTDDKFIFEVINENTDEFTLINEQISSCRTFEHLGMLTAEVSSSHVIFHLTEAGKDFYKKWKRTQNSQINTVNTNDCIWLTTNNPINTLQVQCAVKKDWFLNLMEKWALDDAEYIRADNENFINGQPATVEDSARMDKYIDNRTNAFYEAALAGTLSDVIVTSILFKATKENQIVLKKQIDLS